MSVLKEKRTLLTEQELNVLAAYRGCGRDVARQLGISPSLVQKILKRPAVEKAIEKRQEMIVSILARKHAKELNKAGITREFLMDKLKEIICAPPETTGNSYAGQLRGIEIAGRWIGCDLKVAGDPADMFRDRTVEENIFFAQNGYFPEDATARKRITGGNSEVN